LEELFDDILRMEDVRGVMLLSFEGKIAFAKFLSPLSKNLESNDWISFLHSLNGVREADLVFQKSRLYIRKAKIGYLLIVMGIFAPAATIRLNCDILLPSLKQMGAGKGLLRLFKKKR
jgi:hypothetical protein